MSGYVSAIQVISIKSIVEAEPLVNVVIIDGFYLRVAVPVLVNETGPNPIKFLADTLTNINSSNE